MGLRRFYKNLRKRYSPQPAASKPAAIPKETYTLVGRTVTAATRSKVRAAVRETGFWFIDIPRTSSSSIRSELGRRYGPAYAKTNILETDESKRQIFEDHIPAREMRWFLGPELWDSLFTFTVVRNPWERVFSLYGYMRRADLIPDTWTFDVFMAEYAGANEYTPPFRYHGYRLGAADYILDEDGTILVSHIVRFEDRERGLAEVSRRLGMPDLGLAHLQRSSEPGTSYREHYTPRTRQIIEDRFARDIALFDYSF